MRLPLPALACLVFLGGCTETPRSDRPDGRIELGTRDLTLTDRGRLDQQAPPDLRPSDGPPPSHDSQPPTLDGSGSFDGKPGTFQKTFSGRSYRLFVPSGYSATTPIACVLAFHGSGDTGANFFTILSAYGMTAAAAPAKFILVVPETKSPNHDFAIWSGNLQQDAPAMKTELDDLLALVDDLGKHYRLDAQQLHAFGFSNGGVFTAVAGFARTDRLASLTIAGYGWGGAGYPLVTPARPIATQFVVGTNDSFHALAQASSTFLQGKGHDARFLSASGVGHKLSGLLQAHPASTLFSWMQQHPHP